MVIRAEFFGGPCDGLIRDMYDAPRNYYVPVPAPVDYNVAEILGPQSVTIRTLTYERRRHRDPQMVAYCFRGYPTTPPGGQRSHSDAPPPTDTP